MLPSGAPRLTNLKTVYPKLKRRGRRDTEGNAEKKSIEIFYTDQVMNFTAFKFYKNSLRASASPRPLRLFFRCSNSICVLLVIAGWLPLPGDLQAAEQKYWELSPYRIHLQVAVDTSVRPQMSLENILASRLSDRVDATLSPLWSLELAVTTGAAKHQLLEALSPSRKEKPLPWNEVPENQKSFDKLMLLTIEAKPDGYRLRCQELDCLTRRWGPLLERTVAQRGMLPEASLQLLCDAFAPLATVRSLHESGDPEDENQVELRFKGSELPSKHSETLFQQSGDVYQPIVRRTDRTGELMSNGIQEVPWTYLTLGEAHENCWRGDVHTGMRRPFGVRRHGQSQQLAIALRHPPTTTHVRFYARHDPSQGLAGYEVYQRDQEGQKPHLLGVTDASGMIPVQPGNTPVTTLLLRSDGRLLAKVPVVPGALPTMEVPIADDTARLRAQARLSEVREQLIDLVARRNILMARVRDRLGKGKLSEAQQLMEQLDALPGRSQFNQVISSAEKDKGSRSDDAKVQARIEKMFADTRSLLGRFLDTRPISELQTEVNEARRGAQGSP